MSPTGIAVLGAIAGFTIFLGLPVARLPHVSTAMRAALNAGAIGVLLFLFWDVLEHAVGPVEEALTAASDGTGSWGRFGLLSAVLAVGLGVGLLALVSYDSWVASRRPRRFGPGAMAAAELVSAELGEPAGARRPVGIATAEPTAARRLAMLIAVGIGLHNFSEGLAIGQSAAAGETSLALMLVIGFALHNATEGFGITAPLVGHRAIATWGFLGLLGLIGGGPTLLGTIVGRSFVNDTVYLAFLALAAGSILYVVVQLLRVADRIGHRRLLYWGLLVGLLAGFATDFILSAAGG
jgi:zinc transporter, ZIP family